MPGLDAPPAHQWLLHVRELLHESFRTRMELREIAASVGVTQWHMARAFRSAFRMSIGEYVRTLRLDYALRRIRTSRAPISIIALEAGFADQSHLTRTCKAAIGLTPACYRRCLSSGSLPVTEPLGAPQRRRRRHELA